jgi:hypothetical protein
MGSALLARTCSSQNLLTLLRILFLTLTAVLLSGHQLAGQRAPVVSLNIPDAPRGCFYLSQDKRGDMWLIGCETGYEGLYLFDGSRFLAPLLLHKKVVGTGGVEQDSTGGLWIAETSGIYRVADGKLNQIAGGTASNGLIRIAPDTFLAPLKKVDTPQQTSMVRITRESGKWNVATILTSILDVRLTTDKAGNILFFCPGGYCELKREEAMSWRPGESLRVETHKLQIDPRFVEPNATVWRDAEGCVWLRNHHNAAVQCPGQGRVAILPPEMIDTVGDPSVLEGPDSMIAIPSFSKVALGRPVSLRVITAAQGYPSTGVAFFNEDGTLWLSGANHLSELPLHIGQEFWTEQDGLEGNTWSMTRVGEKMYAIAGNSIRVLAEDRSRWTLLTRVQGAGTLLPGPRGTLLVGSATDGVVWIDARGKVLGRSAPGNIRRLIATPDGRIWAAGESVFQVVLKRSHIALVPVVSGSNFPGPVRDLAIDREGTLWACTETRFSHQGPTGWTTTNIETQRSSACDTMAVDTHGNVWFGSGAITPMSSIHNPASANPVLLHLKGTESSGDVTANFLASDRGGWLWRGSSSGTFVATPEMAVRGDWIKLDRESGFAALDANQRAFFEDRDGSVWFGEDNHIVHVMPPPDLVSPARAPSLFVSALAEDGKRPVIADASMRVQSGKRLTVMLGSLQMDRRSSLRIRYRLVGEAGGWRTGSSLDLHLGALPWGRHTVEAQAQLLNGPWSPVTSYSFEVLRSAWLSWPAFGGYLATGSALAALDRRRRQRRKERAAKLLPELAEWRLAALSPELAQLAGNLLGDRFEVGRVLARGGFATVAEGRDLQEGGRPCAIKLFRQELMDKDWMARRFQQEVRALAKITHPNVVRIYSHGETATGAAYLIMEFVDGNTLREMLEEGCLAPLLTASYLRQIGAALDAIHAHGICHRDLKPENLMIRHAADWGREVVLIDFSIAIVKDPDETLHGLSRAAGTIYYMAPEQAIGYADASTDIYSLAKILIEMLTGKRLSELLPYASMDLPARVRELLADLPLELSSAAIGIVGSALEFDPARRPRFAGQFAHQIAEDLEQVASRK